MCSKKFNIVSTHGTHLYDITKMRNSQHQCVVQKSTTLQECAIIQHTRQKPKSQTKNVSIYHRQFVD